MSDLSNPSIRLATLLTRLTQSDRGGPAVEGWSRILSHPERINTLSEVEVAQALGFLQEEVERIRRFLQKEKKSPESYQAILDRTKGVLSIQLLGRQWVDVQQQVAPELASALYLLGQFLPGDSPVLDESHARSALDEINQWFVRVGEVELPEHVKAILTSQLRQAKRAIWESQYRGAQAVEDAVLSAAVHLKRNQSDLAPFADDETVKGVQGVWSTVEKYCKRAMLVGGAVTALMAPIAQVLGAVYQLKALSAPAHTDSATDNSTGPALSSSSATAPHADAVTPQSPTSAVDSSTRPNKALQQTPQTR